MTKKAFKCRAEVSLHSIRSAGTWLPNRDDLYLTVELLGSVKRTRLLLPIFPAHVNDKLVFERTFWSPVDPQEVLEMLEDLPVSIELRQVTDVYLGGTLLAYYDSNARDFLYPQHSRAGMTHDDEILMTRTVDFPGVSPRLEFSTHTVIDELPSSYLDPAGEYNSSGLGRSGDLRESSGRSGSPGRRSRGGPAERGLQSFRRRSGGRPTEAGTQDYERKTVTSVYRSRSPSPTDRLRASTSRGRPRSPVGSNLGMQRSSSAMNVSMDRPPFVVKRVSPRLLARSPTYYDDYYDLRPGEKNGNSAVEDRPRSNTPSGRKLNGEGEALASKGEKMAQPGSGHVSDKEAVGGASFSKSGSDAEHANGDILGNGDHKAATSNSVHSKSSRGRAAAGKKKGRASGTDSLTDDDKEVDRLTSTQPLTRSMSHLSIRDRYSPILDGQLDRIRRRVDDALWKNRRYPYSYYYPYYPYYLPPYYYSRYPYYRYYDPWWLRSYLY